jgi:hypothetical protein
LANNENIPPRGVSSIRLVIDELPDRGADLKRISLIPPIEIRSPLEREAHDMREALYAVEFGYDEANICSMSLRAQELIAKLREVV